jgi:hypothetical protein
MVFAPQGLCSLDISRKWAPEKFWGFAYGPTGQKKYSPAQGSDLNPNQRNTLILAFPGIAYEGFVV